MPDTKHVDVEIPEWLDEQKAQELIERALNPEHGSGDQIIFNRIEVGHEKEIRISRDIYKNRVMYNIRQWYVDNYDEWQPGKGCVVKPESLHEIIEGLLTMEFWCQLTSSD